MSARKLLSLLFVFGLVVAACSPADTTATTDAPVTTEAPETTEGTEAPEPTTTTTEATPASIRRRWFPRGRLSTSKRHTAAPNRVSVWQATAHHSQSFGSIDSG